MNIVIQATILERPSVSVEGKTEYVVVCKAINSPTDRDDILAISTGWNNRKLAARLAKAVNAQEVFSNFVLAKDVNGRTYVQSKCAVMGRYLNSDLKRLGF